MPENGESKEKMRELSARLPLCYLGACSKLFMTDAHYFSSTKHGSLLPSKVWQLRVEEEVFMSNHICPQNEEFQPHFSQPRRAVYSTAFQLSIKKSWPQEQWLNAGPLTPEEVEELSGYRCVPYFSFSLVLRFEGNLNPLEQEKLGRFPFS